MKTCGASWEEHDVNGCRNGGKVLDQCEQCTTWECEQWDAVERDT